MSLLALPSELLLEICSYQSPPDVYSFLRTNRRLATLFRYCPVGASLRTQSFPAARQALYSAAGRKDILMIEYMVMNGIFTFVDKDALLHYAATSQSADVVETLLDTCDLNVEHKDFKGRSLLSIAAAVGATDIVKLLLNRFKDIDVNSQDLTQLTPLHLASYTNRPSAPELLTHLLQHPRIDPTITNDFGQTPLHTAASHNRHALVPLLLQHPLVDPNQPDSKRQTALLTACKKGFDQVAKALIKHPRANVNGANAQGWTPLNLAIMSGKADVVKRLLADERVLCNIRVPRFCWTGLHLAVAWGKLEVLKILVKDPRIRKDLKAVDEEKDTPMELAVKWMMDEAVEVLEGVEEEEEMEGVKVGGLER